jgi:hypothetical protein
VIVGFVTAAVCSLLTTTLLRSAWPTLGTASQGVGLEVLDASYAVAYMALGTYVAARIAGRRSGYVLVGVFVALSLATALVGLDAVHSRTYQWALLVGAGSVALVAARMGGRTMPSR